MIRILMPELDPEERLDHRLTIRELIEKLEALEAEYGEDVAMNIGIKGCCGYYDLSDVRICGDAVVCMSETEPIGFYDLQGLAQECLRERFLSTKARGILLELITHKEY